MQKSLSIVIPVYNSQDSLPLLIQDLSSVLTELSSNYEIILVNDGSKDQSWKVIRDLSASYSQIRAFELMRNYGQHNALLCGIRESRGDIIVTMDDDLQHSPGYIPQLLLKLDEGYDVVYGVPETERHNFWRNLTSKLIKWILKKAMRVSSAQEISAFRVFRSEIKDSFSNYDGVFVSIDVLLSWGTTRFSSVRIKHNKRLSGRSQYSFKRLLNHAFTLITGFSILPLQISSLLGFLSMLFGFSVLIYVFINFIKSGGAVPGFTFLASTIAIFSGVQLFAIGIIGEYLGRLFSRNLGQPTYTVRSHYPERASTPQSLGEGKKERLS